MSASDSAPQLPAGNNDAAFTTFVNQINWSALLLKASETYDNTSCKLSEDYTHGQNNLVRKLEFIDGTQWVARLLLPDSVFDGELLSIEKKLQVEIATMNYIRKHTTIPVPEVFTYDLSSDNEIGAPYILMSHIPGTNPQDLAKRQGIDLQQKEHFWRNLADIQIQCASLHFNQIGSIYQSADGTFTIGPEIVTGLGPWDNTDAYWSDLIQHYVQNAMTAMAEAAQEAGITDPEAFQPPAQFAQLPQLIQSFSKTGPFRLANRDFGIHNILVNDNFEIVGLLDLGAVIAAPMENVAQMPRFSGLDLPLPDQETGAVEENPAVERYLDFLEEAAKKSRDAGLEEVVKYFTSMQVVALQGLYRMHQTVTGSVQ